METPIPNSAADPHEFPTTEVGWFELDELPELSARELTYLETALRPDAQPFFAVPTTALDETA